MRYIYFLPSITWRGFFLARNKKIMTQTYADEDVEVIVSFYSLTKFLQKVTINLSTRFRLRSVESKIETFETGRRWMDG